MNIVEVPKVLFNEFSKKLGKGKEKEVLTDGLFTGWVIKELNPEIAGFEGVIGLDEYSTEHGLQLTFALWDKDPRGKDTEFEPKPIFKIIAGPGKTGEWAGGGGYKIRETGMFYSDDYRGIDLRNPSLQLIPSILQRASELALKAQYEEFWEVERNPKQAYTKP